MARSSAAAESRTRFPAGTPALRVVTWRRLSPELGLRTRAVAELSAAPQIPVGGPLDHFGTRRALAGQRVEIACDVGRGRTGTALACAAVLAGLPPRDAIAWVRTHHEHRAVRAPWQRWWVHWFAPPPTAALGNPGSKGFESPGQHPAGAPSTALSGGRVPGRVRDKCSWRSEVGRGTVMAGKFVLKKGTSGKFHFNLEPATARLLRLARPMRAMRRRWTASSR
jgi:hypothetical protein